MKFISDVKKGKKALQPYLDLFSGEWEFIAWGQAVADQFDSSDCAFFFQRAKDKNVYALQLVDHGATAVDVGEGDPDHNIVAVLIDPPYEDPDEIVPILLERYRDDGGRYIELYSRTGKFMLP